MGYRRLLAGHESEHCGEGDGLRVDNSGDQDELAEVDDEFLDPLVGAVVADPGSDFEAEKPEEDRDGLAAERVVSELSEQVEEG